MSFQPYKIRSRDDWGVEGDSLTIDQIKLGAVLRIADAVEMMSKNYQFLLNDLKYYKQRYENIQIENDRLRRSVAAYKGIIKSNK